MAGICANERNYEEAYVLYFRFSTLISLLLFFKMVNLKENRGFSE